MFKHPVVALAIISTLASEAAFAGDPINLQTVPLIEERATQRCSNRIKWLPNDRAMPISAEEVRATAR
jgi:hypothetical protein